MAYKTHNDKEINADGTSGRGTINATHTQLLDAFGDSFNFDDYKSDAEWIIEFEDGLIATIYNWKNGFNYLGGEGTRVEDITTWNVGGNRSDACERILAVLDWRHPVGEPVSEYVTEENGDVKAKQTFDCLDRIESEVKERRANARLIAAAPEMLAALKGFASGGCHRMDDKRPDIAEAMDKLIIKVEGYDRWAEYEG